MANEKHVTVDQQEAERWERNARQDWTWTTGVGQDGAAPTAPRGEALALRLALTALLATHRRCTYHGGGRNTHGVHGQDTTDRDLPATYVDEHGERKYCDECAAMVGLESLTERSDAAEVRAALKALEVKT